MLTRSLRLPRALFQYRSNPIATHALSPQLIKARTMHIQHIKMRWGTGDNYAYILTDTATKDSWIIDPAEPQEVIPVVQDLVDAGKIKLTAIVNTHHHYDHAGGNKGLLQEFPKLPVIAGRDSPLVSLTPQHGQVLQLGAHIKVTALHTPCHTQDSISYFCEDTSTQPAQRAVFTGDTLFIAGCGRFFEGTASEMTKALVDTLGGLPDDTLIYPGHEYTKSNVRFVKTVMDPAKYDAVKMLDDYTNSHEITTGVFSMGQEKTYNPFMLVREPAIQQLVKAESAHEAMASLREKKNKMIVMIPEVLPHNHMVPKEVEKTIPAPAKRRINISPLSTL
ncbi:Metallo-hydrolase/oxidoreductase [Nadsonia fulvescens var. elongata DSM 6958]|uniref:hydroxyacylglutathione hydrolase n=1 Tax=Nadsonia fulvescens var. elongata DSM 6958 TaxID=857566 RepID=A0A1E3PIJ8_9ASCO|nr:Metallo-hydrolase/oxidoreductase [Nadsonia fulvescens var. elongata DSM 6958]